MVSTDNRLDIGIVGAGIAGLAAALCLRKAGHKVTIYERSQFKSEVGAAINMPAHAGRILQAWGLAEPEFADGRPYSDTAQGTKLLGTRRLDGVTAAIVVDNRYEGDVERFGATSTSYHRADLHNGLRTVAEERGANIQLGTTVVDVDCESSTLTLSDSTTGTISETIRKDLIILADGVRGAFLEKVTGVTIPTNIARCAFRTLIQTSTLLSDPETAPLFIKEGHKLAIASILGQGKAYFIAYPCRSGTIMNIAILYAPTPEELASRPPDAWNQPADIESAVQLLESCNAHPAFKAVLKHADSLRIFTLSHRDPLPTYVNNRTILIGDSAHPMLPTLAGGGTTAMEDAAALEVLLPQDTTVADLPQRLELWNALRLPRDAVTQVLSQGLLGPKPASSYADDVSNFYMPLNSGRLPDTPIVGSLQTTREFIYHYDVYKVTKQALDWAEKEGWPSGDLVRRLQTEGVVRHFGPQ